MAAVKKIVLAIVAIVAALAMFAVLAAPAQAGQPLAPKGTSVKYVTLKGGAIGKSLKIEKCRSRGSKWERPAPPADPQARCRGRVNVNIKLKITVKCKPGWMGGRASAVVSIRERLRVFAMSKSMAAIARVKVRTVIRDRVRGKVRAWVNCVKIKKTKPTPPKPPKVCPPGMVGYPPHCKYPPTPPPHVDRAPQVSQVLPAHLYVGGNAMIWIEAYDPDGDPVSINVIGSGAGWVSGVIPVTQRWNGQPCPSGKQCFRATAWAGSSPGMLYVTTTATAGGKSTSVTGNFEVKEDDFGGW